MLWWHEYKEYKKQSLHILKNGSDNFEIQCEVDYLKANMQTRQQTLDNIINILSDGQHYSPLHDFTKIGNQLDLL